MTEGFSGFPKAGLAFLQGLAANNDRAWFQAHKTDYERDIQAPFRALVADLATRFAASGVPLTADPLKAMFRIHRDVRFSRDKSPYKTHASAVLSRDGSKDGAGLLYVHLDPAGSFAACGFYQLAPPSLAALRAAMIEKARPFQTLVGRLQAAGFDLSRDDALARIPRGFEQADGSPVAPFLRLRKLIVRRPIASQELASADLPGDLAAFAALCRPLLQFGWAAIAAASAAD